MRFVVIKYKIILGVIKIWYFMFIIKINKSFKYMYDMYLFNLIYYLFKWKLRGDISCWLIEYILVILNFKLYDM